MSATVNTRIQLKRDITANWNQARGFIPLEGEVIIYEDYEVIRQEVNGQEQLIPIPGIKIADGRPYVQDLPFVSDALRQELMGHINDPNIHVTIQEKLFWNNKLNVNDHMELIDGALILNRN